MRGRLVAAGDVDHRQHAIVFCLHLLVIEAELAQQFDPRNLKPHKKLA